MPGFDPEAYLAQTPEPAGFDPDAYLKGSPAPTPQHPLYETALAHAAQGAVLGGAPTIMGLMEAGGGSRENPSFGLGAVADVAAGLWRTLTGDKGAIEAKKAAADKERAYLDELDKANHKTAIFSQILGGGPAAALVAPAAPAATFLGRAGQAGITGAKLGVLSGAARSETLADVPGNVGKDATVGLVAGPLLQGGVEGIGAGVNAARRAIVPWLEDVATTQGRKVLTGNAAPMATRKPLSPEAVKVAYEEGAIRPFGTVEKAANRLADSREVFGNRYSEIIDNLAAKGVTGPDATALALKLLSEADAVSARTLGSPTPGLFRATAEELSNKPVDAAGRLALSQAEDMKRTLQRAAQSEYVKEGPQSLSGEAKTEIASRLRQSVEDAVAAQASKAPAEAAAFEPVKARLSRIIEASNAANRGAARAANRQTHGLGAKVMAAGALESGGIPGAVGTLFGATALRNRGPATVGSLANAMANAIGTGNVSRAVNPEVAALLQAMERRYPGLGLMPASADQDSAK